MELRKFPVRMVGMETVWSLQHTQPSRYNWMLQFFLREVGIALSWTGTGRFIFNHATTKQDFEWFLDRFIQACEKMQSGGWWWSPHHQTSRSIKRGYFIEMLKMKLGFSRHEHAS
jgi:glutamate-1-semialdehyde 2,1-aminomutase